MLYVVFFLCASLVRCIGSDAEGEKCIYDGVEGICKDITDCEFAKKLVRNEMRPAICSFSGFLPVVCCINEGITMVASNTSMTTPVARNTSRTETDIPTTTPEAALVLPVFAEEDTQSPSDESVTQCPPIPANKTSPNTGRKAWDKCIEYQEKYVYPCSGGRRLDYCWSNLKLFIIGGVETFQGEFPHMAGIGYGEDPLSLSVLCGGTLISDRFVLTAGHCLQGNELLHISHVILGVHEITKYDPSNVYKIKNTIAHPMYKPPIRYNDIALLQTERKVKMSDFVIPACIDVGNLGVLQSAVATGWGVTERYGKQSEVLQKVSLLKFDSAVCSAKYMANRHMKLGFHEASQLCFGDLKSSGDTCQGDSGGPLQVKNTKIHCMYTIIGLTSLGRGCGVAGVPALYTRVSEYAEWIESVVWAD